MSILDMMKDLVLKKVSSELSKTKKRLFSNSFFDAKDSMEVTLLRDVLYNNKRSNDEMNDLLLCHCDHVMDDLEMSQFMIDKNNILYEIEELALFIDVKSIIFIYLLSSSDKEVILNVLKAFYYQSFDKTIKYSMYDVYLKLEEIFNEQDENVKKEKAIEFMTVFSIEPFVSQFNELIITYNDIENYMNKHQSDNSVLVKNLDLLLLNKKMLRKDRVADVSLNRKVIMQYKMYASEHIAFTVNDFIDYYNNVFGDDFRFYYYNVREYKPLNVELLYFILFNKNDNLINFEFYKEYLGKFDCLKDLNAIWLENINSFVSSIDDRNSHILEFLTCYFKHIERLKKPIPITFQYYTYLNVPEEYRETFIYIIKNYMNNKPNYFGRNVFIDSDEQCDNTFKLILNDFKESLFGDIYNRKNITRDYFAFIKKMIYHTYISASDFNDYLYKYTQEYYANEGLIHFKAMNELLNNGESLLTYRLENFGMSEMGMMASSVIFLHPEMKDMVLKVKNTYEKELFSDIVETREQIDELIVLKHTKIIEDFIDSIFTSKLSYVRATGISITRFDRAVIIVREKNPELYEQYRIKTRTMLSSDSYNNGVKHKK